MDFGLKEDFAISGIGMNNKKKIIRINKKIMIAVYSLVVVLAVGLTAYTVIRELGRSHLKSKWDDVVPELPDNELASSEPETAAEEAAWQAGWVRYNGGLYEYNKDIMTFLMMGIDKREEFKELPEGTDGGQADALFLLVLNAQERSIKLISINRNAMTDIDFYDENGAYTQTVEAQVAIQHGFGNGMEESCEYQVDAVRRLFYNIPIHGYCAINMQAISILTDMVEGIEVTVLEDIPLRQSGLTAKQGEQLLLKGSDAYDYIQYRDVHVDGSADGRLLRQQQFLDLFMKKVKAAIKGDLGLPLRLYGAITKQMVTDVTAEEVLYLVSQAADYELNVEGSASLKGETVLGKQFEEFYVDDEDLYRLVIENFYRSVELLDNE